MVDASPASMDTSVLMDDEATGSAMNDEATRLRGHAAVGAVARTGARHSGEST